MGVVNGHRTTGSSRPQTSHSRARIGYPSLQLGGRYGRANLPEVRNPVPDERWLGKSGSVPAHSSASGARHGNAGALSSLPSPVRRRRNTAPFLFAVQGFSRSHRCCGDKRCGLGGLSALQVRLSFGNSEMPPNWRPGNSHRSGQTLCRRPLSGR
jgi:hypothetical protein